jgi:hypothetical protein
MRVEHLPCAPFVNASEELAIRHLKKALLGEPGDARFLLVTNVAHSVNAQGQSDEIDLIVIGPTGVQVIEVKHWDRAFVRTHRQVVEFEAEKVAAKSKRVASKVRAVAPNAGFVAGKFLLTKESKTIRGENSRHEPISGVGLHGLGDWRSLLAIDERDILSPTEADRIAQALVPRAREVLTGELRRIDRIVDLRRLTPREERFHRVYAGRDSRSQDRVLVHLYDLTVSPGPNAEEVARREFDTIRRFQKNPSLPQLVDSFQPVPNYPGELFFFTLADTDAPGVAELAESKDWSWSCENARSSAVTARG